MGGLGGFGGCSGMAVSVRFVAHRTCKMSATAAQGMRRARRAAFTGAVRRCMYIFPRI
ncbi:hypothetical protein CBM2585_B120049 [Cupriavidus taiwanensis]|nr:hypothetical protein CBM2585_B120049 [Cupriavidus taiwanensis]